ncbi:seipin-like isoform X3 [Varroa jacobsoni]|uniref:Seipin n=1 Tax=Varroa destructor TaxID=109461 RepID=A0A7M7IZ67_VARDE|nr:seipin-like isoform X1 [Varroa destructor]XP_022694402.1 seipin-like isoform X3 [Varroa jacobsoni]
MLFLLFRIIMFLLNWFRSLVGRPARFVIVNSVMFTTLSSLFFILSFTGYLAAYWALIPRVQIERDVHFKYAMRPCKITDQCQHPVAEVWLGDDPAHFLPALSPGTEYRIELNLELPESETNFDVGMFMASVEMRAPNGQILKAAQRSGVLVYRSLVLRMLHTIVALPSLLLGEGKEKQLVRLPMFDSFVDLPRGNNDFAAVAYIELHSTNIQIYSAKLRIYADFGGLRYLMYRWPLTCAATGCMANFVALWVATALFWIRNRLFSVISFVARSAAINRAAMKRKADSVISAEKNGAERQTLADGKTTTQLSDGVDEVDKELPKLANIVRKIASLVPFVGKLQPYAAILVDTGLRWSPVPIPGKVASIAKQVVGIQKDKEA